MMHRKAVVVVVVVGPVGPMGTAEMGQGGRVGGGLKKPGPRGRWEEKGGQEERPEDGGGGRALLLLHCFLNMLGDHLGEMGIIWNERERKRGREGVVGFKRRGERPMKRKAGRAVINVVK